MSEEITPIALSHYSALKAYLATHLEKELAGISSQRQSARDKLTRLTVSQFHELSTDVYDEMNRRIEDSAEIPFLPVKPEFHPKRNQARQKLATLSQNRFKDLASDVYFELERRYASEINNMSPQPESNGMKEEHVEEVVEKKPVVEEKPVTKNLSHEGIPKEQQYERKNPEIERLKEKDPASVVNFTSLDNLMADLGSMIASSMDETNQRNGSLRRSRAASPVKEESTAPIPPTKELPPSHSEDAKKLREENQKLRAEMRELEATLNQYKTENTNFKQEFEKVKIKIEEMNVEKKRIETEWQNKLKSNETELIQTKKQFQELQLTASHAKELEEKSSKTEKDNEQLKQTLEKHYQENQKLKNDLDLILQSNNELKQQHFKLKEDFDLQKKTIDQHKEEKDDIRKQLEIYKIENEKILTQNIEKDSKLKSLSQQLDKLKGSSNQSMKELPAISSTRSLGAVTPSKPQIEVKDKDTKEPSAAKSLEEMKSFLEKDLKIETYLSPKGLVNMDYVQDFKNSVMGLLKAGRTDTPAGVLLAMKSIVVASRNISETLELYETNSKNTLKTEDIEKLNQLRNNMSQHLTELMTEAKNHATGTSDPNLSQLDSSLLDLNRDIAHILQMIRIRKENDTEPFKIEQLKEFLEKQTDLIVQNIQLLLQNMKQSNFGPNFQSTIQNITSVVENLTKTSAKTLDSPYANQEQKRKGEEILKQLMDCNDKLEELGKGMLSQEKPSKQKLAAAAYEVAKYTKELVSLLDLDH